MKSVYVMLLVTARCISVFAQDTGNVIPFQGQLANQSGQPLSPTTPNTLVFRLYRQAVGGIAIWEESQPNISVNAGRFSVLLGSRTELPAAPNFNATLYLGITVDDANPATADVEMRPRQALVPVVSANYAKNADKLDGYDWSALFGTNNPAEGTILSSKIADDSVNATKLTPGSITANQIAGRTITANQIAARTITGGLIGQGAISSTEIGNGQISTAALGDSAVTKAKLSDDLRSTIDALQQQVQSLQAQLTQLESRVAPVEARTRWLSADELGNTMIRLRPSHYISFQWDGNVVIYRNGVAIWATGTQ